MDPHGPSCHSRSPRACLLQPVEAVPAFICGPLHRAHLRAPAYNAFQPAARLLLGRHPEHVAFCLYASFAIASARAIAGYSWQESLRVFGIVLLSFKLIQSTVDQILTLISTGNTSSKKWYTPTGRAVSGAWHLEMDILMYNQSYKVHDINCNTKVMIQQIFNAKSKSKLVFIQRRNMCNVAKQRYVFPKPWEDALSASSRSLIQHSRNISCTDRVVFYMYIYVQI